jgi:hypothetical protein
MTLAMMMGGTGGAMVLALAALTREPNILGIVGLWDYRPPWRPAIKRNVRFGVIAALPLALWVAYVTSRFSVGNGITGNNLTWPLRGIMGKLGEFSVHAVNGDIRWDRWYSELLTSESLHALLTIIAILTQSIYLFTHREWNQRIWRVGLVFVPYFLCISSIPWESHFTITRHALPITLAFNLVLAMRPRRSWLAWFLLGNCFVPYGVYQFAIYGQNAASPPVEFHVVPAQPSTAAPGARFDQGWSGAERTRKHTWRWAVAKRATLALSNPSARPVEVGLSFTTNSICPRDLTVSVRGAEIWSTRSLQSKQFVQTRRFLLPPGETVVDFGSTAPPVSPGTPGDDRLLSFRVTDLEIDLFAPPAGG